MRFLRPRGFKIRGRGRGGGGGGGGEGMGKWWGTLQLFSRTAVFFKVPCVGLVEIEKLDQWLNVPTQLGGQLRQEHSPSHLRHLDQSGQTRIKLLADSLVRDTRKS